MALTDNLVSYWKFDDTATDSVADNDLTLSGSPSYATGKINNGLDLELSSSQYAVITDAAQAGLDITGDLSISCWVKFESNPGTDTYATFVSKFNQDANKQGYWFGIRNDGGTLGVYWRISSGGSDATATPKFITFTPTTGTWYHFVASYDASEGDVFIYRDGSQIGTDTSQATSIYDSDMSFRIGAAEDFGSGTSLALLDGVIDEVGIWNRVLTGTEITALYNGGDGIQYPFTSTNTTNFFQLF